MQNCLIILCLVFLVIILSKYNEGARDFCNAITREWMKSRTAFTFLFYGAFIYLILNKIQVPAELNTIISTLFGFWFGQKQSTKKEGEQK